MQHNRQTWPAEWLRYKGMHAESAAWMAYYERRMATATAAAAEMEAAGTRYGTIEALTR
jgi:hypothetical protein